jgi:regulator of replication initiation timing
MMDKQIEVVEQKLVEFNGSELLGVKATDGKVYVGISWICDGIGMKETQRDAQVQKIQNDVVLNNGAKKLTLKFQGGIRDALVLDIEFIPLWLAKISITPKMKEKQPELADKLVSYQLKAAGVLAAAFVNTPSNIVQIPTELNMFGQITDALQQSFKAMVNMQQELVETKKEVQEAKEENKQLKSDIQDVKNGLVDVNTPLRSQFNDAVKVYCGKQGLEFNIAYNNIYKILAEQHHVNIKLRAQRSGKKNIDILEELNLLVPAIRIAKTLGGVAS